MTTSPRSERRRLPLRARRGAAVMEFALTLPIMVMMLLASIEFGNYFTQLAAVKAATPHSTVAAWARRFHVTSRSGRSCFIGGTTHLPAEPWKQRLNDMR